MTVSRASRFKRAKPANVVKSIAMDKLSNVKLSEEQQQLRGRILEFIRQNLASYQKGGKPGMFVVQGDAGTGKSVILNSLFNDVQKLANNNPDTTDILKGTRNYLIVNHPEMLKLYHRMSTNYTYINKASLERPTSLINNLQKRKEMADVVIIDEAHLLATSKDAFKRFYGENHLKELLELAKVLVLVYDEKQALRMGCYWDENSENGANLQTFYDEIPESKRGWYNLKQQFRVAAPPDVLDWINDISVEGKIPKYPKSAKGSLEPKFDFQIWDDCNEMYMKLKEKNETFGQCRMLSTYDFPYRLDGKIYYVTCGDFKLRWDMYAPKALLPWSEREDTIDEVGSVYTVQGFDLNYAGVILGRSVGYDKANDCIKLRPELYDDHAGFTKKKNISDADTVKQKIIMNSINVLLTRGTKGLYVYAWDPELRERLARSRTE
ncbi:uncharacterized protein GVI51_H00627 [Nakaseomyces glabratus]|uniref:Schlafen group 3-like DNA/RNA helicase domain-containing protein n=1 Tax=Candida glabrata (strain ATCC 2001 / BCRC 20586 / JCM 3761 / NBRC 0622 / NRRL Y-65 / CBS 138) TaxID=284593 RepID=Q6FSF9_CANGA|nr:uncharacterized protein CAGL0H00825g [Nakaseomyces glabratus]KAH7601255.1 DUF2075 containing protein [Nakaseomyces glabratus]KAH7605639.1 DUF2075 containing protein [Nakaseomyces glabratus]QHS66469.1 uncharacterized protein GVI51_H00627 [Nakaseomyces glabratus]UCS20801.1 uncharacterized protein GW608_H00627 [Nakaseomyces glabratus]UCS26032.1 uncharacterized protein HLK63_H00627 [Nakaseomyces glabratus]|eukprot:XP_446835.1 uncharacterized protein CAGL0H00825g [[Candida] glabrata]